MIKILLDTNIVLDFIVKRDLYYDDAKIIFDNIVNNNIAAYIVVNIVTDIYYIIRKNIVNCEERKDLIKELINILNIIELNKNDIVKALNFNIKDFEDAIQYQCAIKNKVDYLVTRNEKDYENCNSVKIINPKNFLQII